MISTLFSMYVSPRLRAIDKFVAHPEEVQRQVLANLVKKGRDTEWGTGHQFEQIRDYDDFVRNVPLNDYETLKNFIDRMRQGEKNVLWPGRIRWYAKSSGTTNDKSKFIPVSPQALKDTHYRGGTDSVAIYFRNHPKNRMMKGKGLILGGSHQPNYNLPHSYVGDLSAVLMENIPVVARPFRVLSRQTALLADFEQKRNEIARETIGQNVTNLSGVPSWMLSVLNRILEVSGKKYIDDVWPNLEVFFHGGVAFTPYREQYNRIIRNPEMHYEETYNASEGFFGLQNDPNDVAMLLMLDYGVFYEFIPLEEVGKPNPIVLPLWAVEKDKNYALVITTSSGLWRYQIGDTVRFTSTNPYKFVISGRTKSFINAFGEELIVDNAEKGLEKACKETGAIISEYTAAPVFMDDNGKCRHQWLIEFEQKPDSLEHFSNILDQTLQSINSDYEAKRYKDITLQPLEIIVARPNLFNDWLKSKGKLGGQHKVPRLNNNRDIMDQLLQMNQ